MFIRRIIHLFVGSMQSASFPSSSPPLRRVLTPLFFRFRFSAISLPDTPTVTVKGWSPDASLSPEVEAGGDASWMPEIPFWKTQRSSPGLRLWGLTLGMTLDLTSLFTPHALLTSPASSNQQLPLFSTPPPSPDPTARPPPVQVVSSFVDPVGGLPKRVEQFPGGYPSPGKGGRKEKEKRLRVGRSLNAGTT